MPYEVIARLAIAVGIGAVALFYYFRNNTERCNSYEKRYSYGDIQSAYDTPPTRITNDSGSSSERRQNDLCVICQIEELNTSVRKLHCGHIYHVECIETWGEEKKECPVCRKAFQ